MSDTLVNRLRGIYEVGPNAEFGTRSFAAFVPPISLEAADEIERLNSRLRVLQSAADHVFHDEALDNEMYAAIVGYKQ
jgi:hypothetical protein